MSNPSDTKTILIADDDPDILDVTGDTLRGAGYRVLTADSQKEAEAILEDEAPTLAIVDLMMENMDSGFVLSYHIKKKYPDTPVIIMTAVTADTGMEFDATTNEEKTWVKADAFLDKPVRPEQLIAEVKRLINSVHA